VPSKLYLHTQLSELKHKCKRGGKPRAYLEQLRGKDEDEGDDRLALAGRCLLPHGFLSVSPLFPDLSLSLFSFFVCSWNPLLANEDGGVERLFHQHCFLSSVLAFLQSAPHCLFHSSPC